MKKLMFVAIAALSTAAFADTKAVDGVYDVSFTMKTVQNVTKTYTEYWPTNLLDECKAGATAKYAVDPAYFTVDIADDKVLFRKPVCAGFKVDDVKTDVYKVTFEGKTFKTVGKSTEEAMKVVSTNYKGIYNNGKATDGDFQKGLYVWTTEKVSGVTSASAGSIIPTGKAKSGTVAIYWPDFKVDATTYGDGNAAGGFEWDHFGQTSVAFGTGKGNQDKATKAYSNLKNLAGNIVTKGEGYGTWRLSIDTKRSESDDLNQILIDKGCVELFHEKDL